MRGSVALPPPQVAGRSLPVEDRAVPGGDLGEPVALADLLGRHSGLIVLGDPGSGKTTFLRHLTLQLAAAYTPGERLPVLVPVSAYANAMAQQDIRLDDFIPRYFHDLGADFPMAGFLGSALRAGKAVVMLDGLDEVGELTLRHTVVQRVVQVYKLHREPGNKFILTSRIVGYREVRPLADGLAECTLVDFDNGEIRQFVDKWTRAMEKAAQDESVAGEASAARENRELSQAIERSQGIRRLAANPLLLTILALIKRQEVTLPERRVELYDKCVEVLLSSWNRARSLGRPPRGEMDVVETLRVLAPLARWMHRTNPGKGLMRRDQVLRRLRRLYQIQHNPEPGQAAVRFLQDVRKRAGLLLERGPGELGFVHLTFEEYLAAVGLAMWGQQSVARIVRFLLAHLQEPAWEETALLTVGYLGLVQRREQAADAVIAGLLAGVSEPLGAGVVLAGKAVADAWPGGVTEKCRGRTVRSLIQTLQDEERVSAVVRAAAGVALGRLGDPRDGVRLTEDGLDRDPSGGFSDGG